MVLSFQVNGTVESCIATCRQAFTTHQLSGCGQNLVDGFAGFLFWLRNKRRSPWWPCPYSYCAIVHAPRGSVPRASLSTLILSFLPHTRSFRKFASSWWPCWVRIDSGWNCTPSTASCLWRTPMISSSSSVQAVTSRQSGRVSRSITSE